MYIDKKSKIFIAGHSGLVGSAILKHFKKKKYKNLIIRDKKKLKISKKDKTKICYYCCSKGWRYIFK